MAANLQSVLEALQHERQKKAAELACLQDELADLDTHIRSFEDVLSVMDLGTLSQPQRGRQSDGVDESTSLAALVRLASGSTQRGPPFGPE